MVLAPAVAVKGMLFWLMGDLTHADLSVGPVALLCLLIALSIALGPALNALSLGRMKAASLGVATGAIEFTLYLGAAAATAAAVLTAGTIGFVGLVVPHLVRMTMGSNHRIVIPAAALLGGLLLLVADSLSRIMLAPAELPVGILTALVGGPFFIYLILREQKGRLVL